MTVNGYLPGWEESTRPGVIITKQADSFLYVDIRYENDRYRVEKVNVDGGHEVTYLGSYDDLGKAMGRGNQI